MERERERERDRGSEGERRRDRKSVRIGKYRIKTNRLIILAMILLVIIIGCVSCVNGGGGSSKSKGGAQPESAIMSLGDGSFAVSGFSDKYPNTEIRLVVDKEDPDTIGRAATAGDAYIAFSTNATDVSKKKQDGYQKLEIKAYGVGEDIAGDDVSGRARSETFYVQLAEGAQLAVTSFSGTDEKMAPIEWE